MSLLHLETGSPFPATKPGVLRIYSMKFCPWAQLTRLVLAHKNIPHEVVNLNLKKKPEWYFEKNPLGKVPCLEKDGKIIYDSAICNEFLDAVYPDNKLIPADPFEKAVMQTWMERFSVPGMTVFSILINGKDDDKIAEARKGMEPFEQLLADGRQFFGGKQLNLLDIRLWPFLEKIDFIKEFHGADVLPGQQFPRLKGWIERMRQTPAAKGGGTDLENLAKFDRTISNYDVGVKV